MLEISERQSKMDNPEKLATLDTHGTGRRHTQKYRKLEKMSNTDPIHSILTPLAVEFTYTLHFNFVHEKSSLFFFVLNNIKVP